MLRVLGGQQEPGTYHWMFADPSPFAEHRTNLYESALSCVLRT